MAMKCCEITAGALKHSVVIQQKSVSRKSGGGQTVTWSTVATVLARITPRNQSEYLRAMQFEAQTTHRIIIRYRAGITTNMRIQFGSRYFNIQSIIDIEEGRRFLQIDALETAEAAAT